jgi:hypothetical protein
MWNRQREAEAAREVLAHAADETAAPGTAAVTLPEDLAPAAAAE